MEKEREEFVSMLTHDLKTPLTAVMGSVDLVRESRLGAINDEQKEYLDSATESCGEIVEMIDNLLDVYRFESGKMSLAFTEEDLRHFSAKPCPRSVSLPHVPLSPFPRPYRKICPCCALTATRSDACSATS
ncbi:MAG: hypothetical protein M0C28_21275 [Candidatus Moduliflexus flocculans]|nr:hypothetical protein [Candidatus Moduliflexus flocculans]